MVAHAFMLAEMRRVISETLAIVSSLATRGIWALRTFGRNQIPRRFAPRNDNEEWWNARTIYLLSSQEVLGNEQHVRRTLGQPPHQIRIPFGSERNVDSHSPSVASQALLQIAADAVKHLELKGVSRNSLFGSERFGLINDVFVMGSQAVINLALHQNLHQLNVVGVDFRLRLKGDFWRFFVGAFA